MSKSGYALFVIPTLIWGSTWYIILYQLGSVDPIVSVCYRFGLAGILLLAYSKIKGLNLIFPLRQHLLIALQGMLLFGFNYWLVYISEQYLSSGLVAVSYSTIIFLNIFFGAIFLGDFVTKRVILGAIIGLTGTVFIYKADFKNLDLDDDQLRGLILLAVSIIFASLGNILSAYNQRNFKLPVIQTNAFGMLYGGGAMLLVALLNGIEISFDTSPSYVLSLLYLSIFGSVIAFTAYLTLIGRLGAGKAAYVIVAIPVIALTISTIFEGFKPDLFAFVGIGLIILGNVLALRRKNIKPK